MTTEADSSETDQLEQQETRESAGELLKAERERQGFSEKQVADRLHITMHYVRAIETDCYEKLPGTVFARGYIKSYALLLGLDKDYLVELFDARIGELQRRSGDKGTSQSRPGAGARALPWLLVAIAAFLCGFLIFWAYNRFLAPDAGAVTGSGIRGSAAITLNRQEMPVNENIGIDNTARLLVGL